MKLDIESYRTKRAASDIQNIKDDIIIALSNPHHIALWKQGIQNPAASNFSEAFAHFHGFRNITIDRAAKLAQTTQDRFIANKVERILDPHEIENLLNSLSGLSDIQINDKVQKFVQQGFDQPYNPQAQIKHK